MLRRLLNSSEEDFEIGISNLKNLNFNDKKIVDLLVVKSLRLEKRQRFLKSNYSKAASLTYNVYELFGKTIYNNIIKDANKKVYKQILKEIMK
jgi:hypothetical protein